jgi:hypothetical protein
MTKKLSREEILAQIPAANTRAAEQRRSGMYATSLEYDRGKRRFELELTNGVLLGVPVSSLPAIAEATDAQLMRAELSASGGGIHIEELDADFSVPAIVQASVGRELAARAFAVVGGSVKSAAKAEAARLNGAKGGRPPKTREQQSQAEPKPRKGSYVAMREGKVVREAAKRGGLVKTPKGYVAKTARGKVVDKKRNDPNSVSQSSPKKH